MQKSFAEHGTLRLAVAGSLTAGDIGPQDFTGSRKQSAAASDASAPLSAQARLAIEQSTISEAFQFTAAGAPIGGALKRAADIIISFTAIALISPAMLIIFALIKLTSGAPAIYAHPRIGHSGRAFKCYKFRTMTFNAEETLVAHLASNAAAAKEWRQYRKLRDDPRVTALGRVLRKSSLDELPQLFNVLRGDMSCVGPRPIPSDELSEYGESVRDYVKARPGITGIWQVSGRNSLDYASRVALDCHYIQHWSFWTDIAILFKTPFIVMNFDETS